MADLIEPAMGKLPGLWVSLGVGKYAQTFFQDDSIEIYKVLNYPGGSFVVFSDEEDLVATKLKWDRDQLETAIYDWTLSKTIQSLQERAKEAANGLILK